MYAIASMPAPVQEPSRPDSEGHRDAERHPDGARYEALPGIAGLPGWVWRRLPKAGKIAVALFPVVVIVLVLLLAPGIDQSKDERARAQAERQARQRAELIARLRVEQRPRFRSGRAAGSDVALRASLVREARGAVGIDARRRVAAGSLEGPIRRVACEPYPRTVGGEGAHLDPARESGRYSCLAVTREVPAGERAEAAAIGHPYRVLIDFASGRYAFCKVSGRAGEGSIGAAPSVTVPRACGGD
jgi:hypothetical protein